MTRREWDRDDGTIDRIQTYSYDVNGNRIRTEFDTNNDGTTDRSEAYAYDANGNRVRFDLNTDANGTINHSVTYATGGSNAKSSGAGLSQAGADDPDPAFADSFIFAAPADPDGSGVDLSSFDLPGFNMPDVSLDGRALSGIVPASLVPADPVNVQGGMDPGIIPDATGPDVIIGSALVDDGILLIDI